MKQRSKKIIASLVAVIPILAAVVPHPAFADFITNFASDVFWKFLAYFTEFLVTLAGSGLTIVGSLLNATMTATLNMSQIVNNTPAIGIAWTTIRDFGSVFIIFLLLDASIRMILGIGSGIGKLIKNIVIAGLLINFSLFFTKLAVDGSNIISLSFYSAIAPTGLGQTNTTVNASNSGAGSLVGLVSDAFDDGGLSNVFMQSLDIQSFANSASSNGVGDATETFTDKDITLSNVGAVILMAGATTSFLAAAIAFAVRIGVLILLMAFSPILFIGMIFPDLEKYRKKWTGMLYAMCIFMPVYLLLMYVAMSVLNDPHFFDFAKVAPSGANITGGVGGALIGPHTIGIVLQYIIAIFLINAPLAAAISIASEGADFVGDMMKKVSKWGQGVIGPGVYAQHTLGRAASAVGESERFKRFAKEHTFLGTYASQGFKGIAGSSFGSTKGGFDERTKKYSKAHQDVAKSLELTGDQLTRKHYDIYNNDLRKRIAEAQQEATDVYDKAGDLAKLTPAEQDRLEKRALDAQKKADDLKAKLNRTDNEKEDDVKKIYQEQYAKNLQKGPNLVTRKARKDATRNILKGLNKNKKDKLFDDLKKELEPEKKDADADKK